MADPIDLWFTRCPVPTPLGIAVRLGFLDDALAGAGVRLQSLADASDRATRESHFTHALPFSFRQGGNVPPLRARAGGAATRLVGLSWTDEFQAVVALPGRLGANPAALRGRRLGLPRRPPPIVDFHRATALKGLASALGLAGLTLDEADLVNVLIAEEVLETEGAPTLHGLRRRQPYGAELAALLRGEVDAVFVKGTQGVAAANLHGLEAVASFGFHPDPAVRANSGTPRVLTVDAALADERPDLVARIIAATRRAAAWAGAHPEEARRLIAREAGASEEQVQAANGPDLARGLALTLDPALLAGLAAYKDVLLTHGFLPADVPIEQWVDRRPWALLADAPAEDAA